MAPRIESEVSESVWRAIEQRSMQTGESQSQVVDSLLSQAFGLERHSIYQVSTSNALVQGVFGGTTTVGDLRGRGDFGLGTFSGLDGEMIMIDGACFRATAGGAVTAADDEQQIPFALVTRFHADAKENMEGEMTLENSRGDARFVASLGESFCRTTGRRCLRKLSMRAACKAHPGEGLVAATRHQSEFEVAGVEGTLVGFWAPDYVRTVSISGYHFHFISDHRTLGGHVLGLVGRDLHVQLHTESDLHLALPETAEFLSADLGGDHAAEVNEAETRRQSS
ncbi:MAG: acetolactate decarboxylase [Acidimicrobiia bacterium]